MLTVERLKQRLHYDPASGQFTWISVESGYSRVKIGTIAGATTKNGYVVIKLDQKIHMAHRLAFLFMNGEWPIALVDHKDGNPANNAWANLREASAADNQANKRQYGASGAKGVVWHKKDKMWQAQITRDGKSIYLGQYSSKAAAAAVYAVAARDLHGEFARLA